MVKFIDFSNDGYLRQNKKKSKKSNVNLKDVDNATGRYTEVLNLILYGKSYLNYLTEDEYIEDTITLNGDDWTFSQHVIIDNKPNIDDFNKTVKIYIAWKTSEMILGHLKKERMTSKKMTDNEEGAISSLKNDNIKYADFKIGELFDVHPTKSYGLTNAELHKIKGNVPVLSNSSINNGIAEYIGLKPTEKGNMITFSDTTVGADTIFYQPLDYVGYSHVQGMYPYIKDNWNENTLLYFIATFKRTAGKQFDFSKKFSRDIVSDMLVKLPVISLDSNEIDFEHMNNLISAIKKTVTKNIF
jgi:hypothetical protein